MQKATKTMLLLAGSAVMMSTMFSACKSKDSSLPSIGGYNSSNDVASTSLMAHWSFESSMSEGISSTAPTASTGVTYTTGVDGTHKAASFASGYALYPNIAKLETMTSFTVSAWVKTANNGTTTSCLFSLTAGTAKQTDWNKGPIEMYVETGKPLALGDTTDLHTAFASYANGSYSNGGDNINDYSGTRGIDYQTVLGGTSRWIHYVATYDASDSSRIKIYANGVKVSNIQYEVRKVNNILIGNMSIQPGTQVLLGSFANSAVGFSGSAAQVWQGMFTGTLDELRVYSKPLSATDINALYQLELVGR